MDFSTALSTYNAVSSGDPSAIASAVSGSVPGGIGGLGEGITIAEAATGDPQAILALATNPQAVIDFAKNYNPIAVGSDLASVFSANGVGADFFSKFPFASFLDNSTYHWKSRQSALRQMTPEQRVSWFIKGFTDASYGAGDAILYNDFFGKGLDQNHHISYDAPNLPYQLASAYNATLVKYLFGGDPNKIINLNNYQNVTIGECGIDVTATKDYAQVLAQIQAQAQAQYNASQQSKQVASVASSSNMVYIIMGFVLLALVIFLIIKHK